MNKRGQIKRDIIVIGGSAGALESLKVLVGLLPPDLNAAIFVTVHSTPEFPSVLPFLLSRAGCLPAFHPKDEDPIRMGSIYIAPPDFHLLLEDSHVRVSRGPRENLHRPAVDPMFRSAARSHGRRVAAVVLSGHLDDGSAGLLAVKMAGGLAIIQDPAEALCPEMPSRARHYAGADYVLPVSAIAALIGDLSKGFLPALPSESEADETQASEIASEAEVAVLETESKEKAGQPSVFSCPECHGVLWEVEEGDHLRFRCRVGHGFTAATLQVALSQSTEDMLWAAMRVLEEKAALLRRMAARSGNRGVRFLDEAEGFDQHIETIRKILVENQNSIRLTEEETDYAGESQA